VIEVDKLIEGWTQGERLEMLAALTKLSVGCIQIDKATNTWALSFRGHIPAKGTGCVIARSYTRLNPSRLHILEPSFERVEREIIAPRYETVEKWWGRTTTSVIEPAKIIEHKSIITVPRSIWRLRAVFIGANAQFPSETDLPGDLFGPNSQLKFADTCEPGLDITLQVHNNTEQEMPFHAAILGIEADASVRLVS